MVIELQNLNELRYVIEMEHEGYFNSMISSYYLVNHWPDPELGKLAHDQLSTIEVFDSVYYTPNLVEAKVFSNFAEAQKESNILYESSSNWTSKVIAVSAKVFFKARLMG